MRPHPTLLINTPCVEAWPAWLLRARGNADARLLARARHVLRRKDDGRYLAAVLAEGVAGLLPGWSRQAGIDQVLDHLQAGPGTHASGPGNGPSLSLPLDDLHRQLDALALDGTAYAARTGLAPVAEPAWLALAGRDRFGRPLWLTAATVRGWHAMRQAAAAGGVVLEAISGYRSHAYQLGIVRRKLGAGQTLAQILTVNAAPGFSEHHSGQALDIGTPGEPPAQTSFEATAAFAWLQGHAGRFGFHMSYPRDNPHGIVYEPWHWCFVGHPDA